MSQPRGGPLGRPRTEKKDWATTSEELVLCFAPIMSGSGHESYFGAAMDQSVNGTARPPRITVGITWSNPLWSLAE